MGQSKGKNMLVATGEEVLESNDRLCSERTRHTEEHSQDIMKLFKEVPRCFLAPLLKHEGTARYLFNEL